MIMDGISVEEFAEIRAREAYDTGRAEGEQAGIAQGILETARKMHAEGLPADVIKKVTGLSPEEYQN